MPNTPDQSVRETLEKYIWKNYPEQDESLNVEEFLDGMMPLIAAEIERAVAEERQFTLNVLEGVDIADKQTGNKGGGTEAIRLALQSRYIGPNKNL